MGRLVPLLVVASLAGGDEVDATTTKNVIKCSLRKRQKEEEEERRRKEKEHEELADEVGAERSSSAGRRRKRKKRRKKRTLEPRHTHRMAALVVDIGSGMFLAGVLVSVLPTLCSLWLSWFFWEMTSGKWWSVLVPCLWIHAHASVYVGFTEFHTLSASSRTRVRVSTRPQVSGSHLFSACLARVVDVLEVASDSLMDKVLDIVCCHRDQYAQCNPVQKFEDSTVQFCVGCCHARCCVRQVRKGQTVQKTVEVPQLLQFP